ncbi:hypothetical protein [Hyalangium sp.]|uniref:hypothetical protein n=1 Tax=Hyalangium sp. TaxID=2028555 RepID=UPI002D26F265|nr:hypothetical protein [Hyalangium sp.]HYH97346.1 hypothetical protein [Hyalangium sp.]
MGRFGWIGIMLFAVHGTAWAADCEWKAPQKPPIFTLERWGGARFSFTADPRWFQCAKKAGGTLSLQFTVSGENEQRSLPPRSMTSYSDAAGLSFKEICEQGPGDKTVQATLVGKGQLARLDFTSQQAHYYCSRCDEGRRLETFVLFTDPQLTPTGMYTFQAKVDEAWHKCAREGSTLELWLYAAPTRLEAQEMKEPTHKVAGLESSPTIKKSFARAPICQDGVQWLGYELRGTGELQLLYEGRAVGEARCPH